MIKAYIQYTDYMDDCRIVHTILAQNNIMIKEEKEGFPLHPVITIIMDTFEDLNNLLFVLNSKSK